MGTGIPCGLWGDAIYFICCVIKLCNIITQYINILTSFYHNYVIIISVLKIPLFIGKMARCILMYCILYSSIKRRHCIIFKRLLLKNSIVKIKTLGKSHDIFDSKSLWKKIRKYILICLTSQIN